MMMMMIVMKTKMMIDTYDSDEDEDEDDDEEEADWDNDDDWWLMIGVWCIKAKLMVGVWWLIGDGWWLMVDDWWLMADDWWLMIKDQERQKIRIKRNMKLRKWKSKMIRTRTGTKSRRQWRSRWCCAYSLCNNIRFVDASSRQRWFFLRATWFLTASLSMTMSRVIHVICKTVLSSSRYEC